ncbi:cupin domain-containing protein [Arhodomonas sp. AD133]|uniref:cupin domain-containing protein n=1 Tax=Arhodomonas sp. AD133 TaxID=3415009 RepID=UPI003EBC46E1
MNGRAPRMTVDHALQRLVEQGGGEVALLFEHGSLAIEYYKPDKVDRQQPHTRDEVYVIASGAGHFVKADQRHPVTVGEVLFVPAGVVHRFEQFSEDFATWVIFYGPEGGEAP